MVEEENTLEKLLLALTPIMFQVVLPMSYPRWSLEAGESSPASSSGPQIALPVVSGFVSALVEEKLQQHELESLGQPVTVCTIAMT